MRTKPLNYCEQCFEVQTECPHHRSRDLEAAGVYDGFVSMHSAVRELQFVHVDGEKPASAPRSIRCVPQPILQQNVATDSAAVEK